MRHLIEELATIETLRLHLQECKSEIILVLRTFLFHKAGLWYYALLWFCDAI